MLLPATACLLLFPKSTVYRLAALRPAAVVTLVGRRYKSVSGHRRWTLKIEACNQSESLRGYCSLKSNDRLRPNGRP